MAALLYFATAAACVFLAHRTVTRISRAAAVALVLLPLAFTGKALLTGRVYAPVDLPYMVEPLKSLAPQYGVGEMHNGMLSDVFAQIIPWKYAMRLAYASGEWALWSPFSLSGDLLAASGQPAAYEPLFLLSLLLPMATSLTFIAAMTFFLGGLLMFLFLRDLDLGEIPALAGAIAWTYSIFLVFWLEYLITQTTIWFPLVLLGVRRVIRTRTLASAAILTAAFTLMLLSGHPESSLHIVTAGLAWAAVEFWFVRGRGFVRASLLGAGAGLVALLATAIYLLPMMEALPQTMQHAFRETVFAGMKKSVALPKALEHLSWSAVPFRYGDPSFPGQWREMPFPFAENAYCGSIAYGLALFGLWLTRIREKWLAAALVAAGLLAGCKFPPFADWIAILPLHDIALNARLIFLAVFGIAILAAAGCEVLLREGEQRKMSVAFAITAAALGVAVLSLWKPMEALQLSPDFLAQRTIALLAAPALAAVILLLRRPPAAACLAIALLLLAQRTWEMGDFYATLDRKVFFPPVPLFRHLPRAAEPYRIVGVGDVFHPNTSALYQLEDVRGYQAMTFHRYVETYPLWSFEQPVWSNRVDDLSAPFLSMLNVRYAIAESGYAVPEGWVKIGEQPGSQLFENRRALARAFVPRLVRVPETVAETITAMAGQRDFSERAWIRVPGSASPDQPNGPGRVAIERRGFGELFIRASMENAGWVVISEAGWKGWRAYLDGKPAEIRTANHAFLAVLVPRGEHTLRLLYLPRSFVIGRAITFSTIGLLAVFMLWNRAASRRKALRSGRSQ